MNANAIQKHHDYAYTPYPGRGRTYHHGAKRVKVLHVYKVEHWSREKRMTLVECQRLTNEGLPETNAGIELDVITVPARYIVCAWEEHVIERDRREGEREEQQRKADEARAERLRLEEEQRKARVAEQEKTLSAFTNAGIPRELIHVEYSYISIRIPTYRIKEVTEALEQNTKSRTSTESDAARETSWT